MERYDYVIFFNSVSHLLNKYGPSDGNVNVNKAIDISVRNWIENLGSIIEKNSIEAESPSMALDNILSDPNLIKAINISRSYTNKVTIFIITPVISLWDTLPPDFRIIMAKEIRL